MLVDGVRYNAKCLRKIKENRLSMKACEELKSHLETQKADAKDIYYYLHKKLDDNYNLTP